MRPLLSSTALARGEEVLIWAEMVIRGGRTIGVGWFRLPTPDKEEESLAVGDGPWLWGLRYSAGRQATLRDLKLRVPI